MDIRLLKAEEISTMSKTVVSSKALVLLYKDARVDMLILDELYGKDGWQRHYKEVKGNLFCTLSVYSERFGCWVEKEDVGKESNQDAEKGESSDAFKRAATNWGIGRELYTAPAIWIPLERNEFNEKKRVYTEFFVSEIKYKDRNIVLLKIVDGMGKLRFDWTIKDPRGNAVTDQEEFNLDDFRSEVAEAIKNSKFTEDRKTVALAGIPAYDKKVLTNIMKAISDLEKGVQR